MIHWHKWIEDSRQDMTKGVVRVPPMIATHVDYAPENLHENPVTLFLFRCSKCYAVKVTEVKGHWAK